jgi:hypothetical protein
MRAGWFCSSFLSINRDRRVITMDKQAQERFFQFLKNTYDIAISEENISIEDVIDQIRNELSSFFPEVKKDLPH